jgi:hypothetical protein
MSARIQALEGYNCGLLATRHDFHHFSVSLSSKVPFWPHPAARQRSAELTYTA